MISQATFGMGCFWCSEAIFKRVKGVKAVESGYAGGETKNPSYEDVCTGSTGHAEVCHMRFDSEQVSFDQLLEVFWQSHDPTTLNRQGDDIGTQYRSVIFYHDDIQRQAAEFTKQQLDKAGMFDKPIVTSIEPFSTFSPAGEDHRDYFYRNPQKAYCKLVIAPKVEKFQKIFEEIVS